MDRGTVAYHTRTDLAVKVYRKRQPSYHTGHICRRGLACRSKGRGAGTCHTDHMPELGRRGHVVAESFCCIGHSPAVKCVINGAQLST